MLWEKVEYRIFLVVNVYNSFLIILPRVASVDSE